MQNIIYKWYINIDYAYCEYESLKWFWNKSCRWGYLTISKFEYNEAYIYTLLIQYSSLKSVKNVHASATWKFCLCQIMHFKLKELLFEGLGNDKV